MTMPLTLLLSDAREFLGHAHKALGRKKMPTPTQKANALFYVSAALEHLMDVRERLEDPEGEI